MPQPPFSVIQLTDLHLLADPQARYRGKATQALFIQALTLAQDLQPDLLLLTGDLAHDQAMATYSWLYQQLENTGLAWQWLPGNHDQPQLMQTIKDPDFHLHTDHWQILGLNSHLAGAVQGRLSATQLTRLQQALTNPKPLLIALHHPPVKVGSQWKDALALENADEFWALLKDKPQAKLVVFGHVHQAFSELKASCLNLATPATSVQFTAQVDEFAIDTQALAAVRQINLMPAGHFSTRLITLPRCE